MQTALTYLTAFLAYVGPLLLIMLKAGLVIGGTGSVLEEVGKLLKWQRLIMFGQLLEHVGADVPGFVDKLRKLFSVVAPLVPMVLVFCLSVTAGLACSTLKSFWTDPKLLQCTYPVDAALLQQVLAILTSGEDVSTALAALVHGPVTKEAIECVVEEVVGGLQVAPRAAADPQLIRARQRGEAFLASIGKQ